MNILGGILTATEGEQHQRVDEEELDNVYYHPPQGNLEWSEVGVHAEYVDELQKTGEKRE